MQADDPEVISAQPLSQHRLFLTFSNGERKIFDAAHLLTKGVFQHLKDQTIFADVRVVSGSVEWPGQIDLCHHSLYWGSITADVANIADTEYLSSYWPSIGTAWRPIPPTICVFDGIEIDMALCDGDQQSQPHIHARYGDNEASFAIRDAVLLTGNLPPRQTRLLQGWIELRQVELMDDWNLALHSTAVRPIAPLR